MGRAKGVRKDGVNCFVQYIKDKNRGVWKDGVKYIVIDRKKRRHGLNYSRPCVCGSLYHYNTRHPDCMINKQYEDP